MEKNIQQSDNRTRDPESKSITSNNDNDIGPLGRLAQMCGNYCREFDEIIEAASMASSVKQEKQTSSDRNLEYLSRGFKNLKRKFMENEMIQQRESMIAESSSKKRICNSEMNQYNKVRSPKLDEDDVNIQYQQPKLLQPKVQRPNLPIYSCFWKIGNTGAICGKIFATNEELNDHFKFHTTTELLNDFDFYFRAKNQLFQNKINQ